MTDPTSARKDQKRRVAERTARGPAARFARLPHRGATGFARILSIAAIVAVVAMTAESAAADAMAAPGASGHAHPGDRVGSHAGILVPTADPITVTEVGLSLLTYPPSCVAEFAAPVRGILSTTASAGYSWIPNGLGGVVSAAARAQFARPGASNWGAMAMAQGILGAALVHAEGGGLGRVTALAAVVSSPVRPWRIHSGLAVHTMPGSEYPGRSYDWRNPQLTTFASLERRVGWGGLYAEAIWAAPGADDGYDSALLGLFGVRVLRAGVAVRASLGVGWDSAGAPEARTPFPVPPLVGVTFRL